MNFIKNIISKIPWKFNPVISLKNYESEFIYLSQLKKSDAPALVRYLKDKEISDVMVSIPYPYTMENAIEYIEKMKKSNLHFAIRKYGGDFIGIISARIDPNQPHKAIIGYWLAKRYWGKGIMTEVLKEFSQYLFKEFHLDRIGANCFESNIGSAKVLEKSGYVLEGLLINHYKKHGILHNSKVYGKIKI